MTERGHIVDRKGPREREVSPKERLQCVLKAVDGANGHHTLVPQRERAGGGRDH